MNTAASEQGRPDTAGGSVGSDSCAGACCAVFPMNLKQPLFWHKGKLSRDGAYILDMLIPLTRRQALTRSRRLGYPDPPPKHGRDYGLFTCKHWDEETRLCGAYESRPAMCRDYPYGRPCERGCSYQVERLDGAAKSADSTWVWDVAANGWRPTSSSDFLWDPETGVLRPIPEVAS